MDILNDQERWAGLFPKMKKISKRTHSFLTSQWYGTCYFLAVKLNKEEYEFLIKEGWRRKFFLNKNLIPVLLAPGIVVKNVRFELKNKRQIIKKINAFLIKEMGVDEEIVIGMADPSPNEEVSIYFKNIDLLNRSKKYLSNALDLQKIIGEPGVNCQRYSSTPCKDKNKKTTPNSPKL